MAGYTTPTNPAVRAMSAVSGWTTNTHMRSPNAIITMVLLAT